MVVLVTLNEKRNFKNALSELKRKNEKLFRSVLTALGRDNVFGSTSSGRRRPFLTPLGITVLGYLLVGAENAHSEPKTLNLGSL